MDDSDDDQLQHGEESASSEDNPPDYSVQQFLGRESGSGDADGGAAAELAGYTAQATDDPDDQLEHGEESAARDDNPSDFSAQQFLGHDDGSGDADGGAAVELAGYTAHAGLNSEDTVDHEALIQ